MDKQKDMATLLRPNQLHEMRNKHLKKGQESENESQRRLGSVVPWMAIRTKVAFKEKVNSRDKRKESNGSLKNEVSC